MLQARPIVPFWTHVHGAKFTFVSSQEQIISGLFLYSFFSRKEPLLAALHLVAFIPFSPLQPFNRHEVASTRFSSRVTNFLFRVFVFLVLQWTGMGKSSKSRMDEDFHSLTNETEAKRVALEKLNDASQAYLKAISKSILFISPPSPTLSCPLSSSSRNREE